MTAARKIPASNHCVLENLESRQMFAGGALDPSFSGDGKATFRFGLALGVTCLASTAIARPG
jgi:hypothetical protein